MDGTDPSGDGEAMNVHEKLIEVREIHPYT